MLNGFCNKGEGCVEDCNKCIEREGEEDMSEICDLNHEEIVYFSGRCPLCEALYRLEALNDILDDLLMVLEPEGVEA